MAICAHCGGDLAPVIEYAHYCPRCGRSLLEVGPPLARPLTEDEAAGILAAFLKQTESLSEADVIPVDDTRAEVVKGYANAMYRLGCRYHQGRGVPRNIREAARCYGKAVRLGSTSALMHFITDVADSTGDRRH